MITKNTRIRCDLCGKFVPFNEYYTWTEYGYCYSEEPPDPNHAHVKCFENIDEDYRNLINRISWCKPYHHKYE